VLVSPAEPASLRALGQTSPIVEQYGADFLWPTQHGLIGVQRKEMSDFIASVGDGRLFKEVAQLSRCFIAVLIVEGRPSWTGDGELMHQYARFTRRQFRGLLYSVQQRGVWVERTDDMSDTIAALEGLESWTKKTKHTSMDRRPKAAPSVWGTKDAQDYANFVLQGIPGMGEGMATKVLKHFGRMPIGWTVSREELLEVPGVGPGRADKWLKALPGAGQPQEVGAETP
jgi:ERCC4-type nuclease